MWNPLNKQVNAEGTSFLPDDYVERKADRRANLIYLTLFSVVIAGVVGAFFVTNRQWATVKKHQEAINVRYAQAAKDIEQLKVLEGQKQQMLGKAELTTALIEKAPRSVLLAELINRMPDRLTLLDLELDSKRIDPPKPAAKAGGKTPAGSKSLASKAGADDKADATPKPPRYDITLVIIGVAPTHSQVAQYVSQLQGCPLLDSVELKFSENTSIDDKQLDKFRIEAKLRATADARRIEPLTSDKFDAFGHTPNAERDPSKQTHQLQPPPPPPPTTRPSANAGAGREH